MAIEEALIAILMTKRFKNQRNEIFDKNHLYFAIEKCIRNIKIQILSITKMGMDLIFHLTIHYLYIQGQCNFSYIKHQIANVQLLSHQNFFTLTTKQSTLGYINFRQNNQTNQNGPLAGSSSQHAFNYIYYTKSSNLKGHNIKRKERQGERSKLKHHKQQQYLL